MAMVTYRNAIPCIPKLSNPFCMILLLQKVHVKLSYNYNAIESFLIFNKLILFKFQNINIIEKQIRSTTFHKLLKQIYYYVNINIFLLNYINF